MKTKKTQRRCLVAIQPIDLQTLYAQMEKIGKQQGAEQQQAAVSRENQQLANKLESERNLTSVRRPEALKSDNVAVNRDGKNQNEAQNDSALFKKKNNKNNEEEIDNEQSMLNYITDPALGRKIDISG